MTLGTKLVKHVLAFVKPLAMLSLLGVVSVSLADDGQQTGPDSPGVQATQQAHAAGAAEAKKSPDKAIGFLKQGNERFVTGQSIRPNAGAERLRQAGTESQGNHAYATVITCSDSRVPVEELFDAGVMDIFVIRVAGNVCDTDETGSIETTGAWRGDG